MKYYESESIELKKKLTNDLEWEIVSFLNSHSGTIYIGVNDKGEVIGVDNYDDVALKISDRIRTNIAPSTEGLININIECIENKKVIAIVISSGIEKPYYIKKKGMSVSGCSMRIGTQTVAMEQKRIDMFYSSRVRNTLSTAIAPKQNLSFSQLKFYYHEKGFEEASGKCFLESLELYTLDHQYNYLAYLLADNNNNSVRVAKYKNGDFIERNEYGSCCLITTIARVLEKLSIENNTAIKFSGKPQREQRRLVNEAALREAVLNMFCHNDYSRGVMPYIIIYEDRFELISYGGLPQGLSKNEFFQGRSLPRNRELMKVMSDLNLGEQIGRGMRKIMSHLNEDDFEISDNFVIVNFRFDQEAVSYLHESNIIQYNDLYTELEQRVLNLIDLNPRITIIEIAKKVDQPVSTIDNVVTKLKEKANIERLGSDESGIWIVPNHH